MSDAADPNKIHPKLQELIDEFKQRFYSKYGGKVSDSLELLRREGIEDIIYYEPIWFLLLHIKQGCTDEPQPKKLTLLFSKSFIYRRAYEIRDILEREHEVFGMKKALVFEEHYLFDEYKLNSHPLDPDDTPLTPLEQAVLVEPGFKRMSLTHQNERLLGGRILKIDDPPTLNKKLYKPS